MVKDQAKALYAYAAQGPAELSLSAGDIIDVLDRSEEPWLKGRLAAGGAEGLFPFNYVEAIAVAAPPPPPLVEAASVRGLSAAAAAAETTAVAAAAAGKARVQRSPSGGGMLNRKRRGSINKSMRSLFRSSLAACLPAVDCV